MDVNEKVQIKGVSIQSITKESTEDAPTEDDVNVVDDTNDV